MNTYNVVISVSFWENILGNTAPKLRLPIKVSQI